MDAQQALDVVDVVVEVGDEQQRLVAELGAQPGDVALVAPGEHVVVGEVLGHAGGELGGQLIAERRARSLGLGVAEHVVVDAVDDHPGERQPALLERTAKPDRLLDRARSGPR